MNADSAPAFTPTPDELTAAMANVWATLASLRWEASWELPTPLGGWSVGDIGGHIVHLEREYVHENPSTDPPPLHELTASGVEEQRGRTPSDVIAELRRYATASPAVVAATVDWEILRQSPIGAIPTWMAYELRLGDLYVHLLDLAVAMDLDLDTIRLSDCEDLLTRRAVRLSGWAAGRAARLPDGTSVSLSLTGPGAVDVTVAVEAGRGRVVPGTRDTADRISGPGIAYVLAAGGRSHPDLLLADLRIEGSQAAALVARFRLFG